MGWVEIVACRRSCEVVSADDGQRRGEQGSEGQNPGAVSAGSGRGTREKKEVDEATNISLFHPENCPNNGGKLRSANCLATAAL
jgi:hypothetical protein